MEDENTVFYDHIDLDDFEYEPEISTFFYPCPCGDRFQISAEEIIIGGYIARCPSCSLTVKIVLDSSHILRLSSLLLSGSSDQKKQHILA